MKAWSKFVTIALSLVIIASMFAGCSKENASSDSNEKVTLEYWRIDSSDQLNAIWKKTVEEWNTNHPESQINLTFVPATEYGQKLATAFASEKGPDIFNISPGEFMKYAGTGVIHPVDKWVEKSKDDYYDYALEGNKVNGKVMAFSQGLDLMGLFYNKELFEKNNIQPPTTWQETLDAAKKLATDKRYGISFTTKQGYVQNFELYPLFWMNGSELIKDGKVDVNNDGTRKALQYLRDLMSSGVADKSSEDTSIDDFAAGNTAMMFTGSWQVGILKDKYPNFKYGVIPYPVPAAGMKTSSDAGGWKVVISAKGKNPDRAGDAIDWMMNQNLERNVEMVKAASQFPVKKSVLKAAGNYYDSYPFDVFRDSILPNAHLEPSFSPEVVKAIGDAIQKALFSNTPIDEIVKTLEQECNKAVQAK